MLYTGTEVNADLDARTRPGMMSAMSLPLPDLIVLALGVSGGWVAHASYLASKRWEDRHPRRQDAAEGEQP